MSLFKRFFCKHSRPWKVLSISSHGKTVVKCPRCDSVKYIPLTNKPNLKFDKPSIKFKWINPIDLLVDWLAEKNGTASRSRRWEEDVKGLIVGGLLISAIIWLYTHF